MPKLTIQTTNSHAVTITRNALKAEKLVYLAAANKKLKYPHGSSRIAYIGTTKSGASRISQSAATKAEALLQLHGVSSLTFFVVTCASRSKVKTWKKLEMALLLTFREKFGAVPKGNVQGKNMRWSDQLSYFTRPRLESVIKRYGG